MNVSPSPIPPSINARWEIDLSPETDSAPEILMIGLTVRFNHLLSFLFWNDTRVG